MEEVTDSPGTNAHAGNGPGDRLREARESEGLSQEQVAHDLHLSVTIVKALERNDFEALPQTTTYLKGYVRSYAKRLGIDPDPLIQAVDRLKGPEPEWVPLQPVAAIEPGFRGMHWISGGVLALVVVMLVAWWLGGSVDDIQSPERLAQALLADMPAMDSNAEEDMGVPAPLEAPPAGAIFEPEAVAVEPQDSETAKAVQALAGNNEPVSAATVPRDGAVGEPAAERNDGRDATGEDVLELTFQEASWAEVYDANDQQLLYGLFEQGAERRLRGTAPFRVMLGYAPGVEVRINDEYYDHLTGVRRNNTVRFIVAGPSGDIE